MLSKTFCLIFPGLRFACFADVDEAIAWARR